MFKKKLTIVLITLVVLIAFTGCNKNTSIAGRWSATFDMTIADTKVTGDYMMTLNDDGTFAIAQTANEESRMTLINVYIEKTKSALEEKKSADEIKTLMAQSGVATIDDLAKNLLIKSAKSKNYSSVDAYVFGINGYEFKTITYGTYKFSSDKLTFYDELENKIDLVGTYNKKRQDITLKLNDKEVAFIPEELDK